MHRVISRTGQHVCRLTSLRTSTFHALYLSSISSSGAVQNTLQQLPFEWIRDQGPVFPVKGQHVTVLQEPSEFYATLKNGIQAATERVVLASLYLGTGPMEQELVQQIYSTCERAQSNNNKLSVHILLDCVRGSRGKENSRTMLLPLVRDFTDYVSVSLYHTPKLRGVLKALIPERYNEAVGLSHLKVYAFDDTLLMSGANLSEMYFTNRQDRYILLENCPELVGFFSSLVSAVSACSFQLQPDNTLTLKSDSSVHPYEGDFNQFKETARQKVQSVLNCSSSDFKKVIPSHKSENQFETLYSRTTDPAEIAHDSIVRTSNNQHIPTESGHYQNSVRSVSNECIDERGEEEKNLRHIYDSELQDPEHIEIQAIASHGGANTSTAISQPARTENIQMNTSGHMDETNSFRNGFVNVETHKTLSVDVTSDSSSKTLNGVPRVSDAGMDTYIIPLVQMGPLDITVDQEVTRRLLADGEEDSVCYLASGYFNLTSEYMETILQAKSKYEILMASPKVNGFYGASGISGYIPDSYTFIARQFFRALCQRGQERRISLYEFFRDGWTFHGKGLWYYLPQQSAPSLTLIGSPNFGHRSVHRDLEAQLAIITSNQSLREQLHEEQTSLYARSEKVSQSTFTQPERRVPLWTRLVTIVTRNFF